MPAGIQGIRDIFRVLVRNPHNNRLKEQVLVLEKKESDKGD